MLKAPSTKLSGKDRAAVVAKVIFSIEDFVVSNVLLISYCSFVGFALKEYLSDQFLVTNH